MLKTHEAALSERLSRLAGHVEWGVKVYSDAPRREPATAVPAASGRDYLRQRRAQRTAREDIYRAAEEAARLAGQAAAAHAVDRVRHRPQQGGLAGDRGESIVNDAYLVPAAEADAFYRDVLASARDLTGARVEVTGPWVPYSFAAPPAAPAPDTREQPPADAPGQAS